MSTVLFTWRRCFDHLWTKFTRSFACSFIHFGNDRIWVPAFWKELLACGLLFFSNLREGVFLLSCLVASKVAQATGGHVVYSPHDLCSLASPISCVSAISTDALLPTCPFPTLLEAPKARGFHEHTDTLNESMPRFQSKSDLKVLWNFTQGKYRIFVKAICYLK